MHHPRRGERRPLPDGSGSTTHTARRLALAGVSRLGLTSVLGAALGVGMLFAPSGADEPATGPAAAPAVAAPPMELVANSKVNPTHAWIKSTATSITAGQPVTFTASVTDARTGKRIAGAKVYLQYKVKGKTFKTIGDVRTKPDGWAYFKQHPNRYTVYRFAFIQHTIDGRTYGTSFTRWLELSVKPKPKPRATAATKVINEAKRHVGKPYVFGATGPSTFDCSGYTKWVYKHALGKNIPRLADDQQWAGMAISKSTKKVGDLLVFRDSSGYGYHTGIYAGGNYMYDAPTPGQTVGKHYIWSNSYVVRRIS